MSWSLENSKNDEASKTVVVYALYSSKDGEIRYIGQTTQALSKRLDSHIHPAKHALRRWVHKWVNKNRRDGHEIRIVPLRSNAVWNETEQELIAQYRKLGAALVNHTDGGGGVLGRKKSDEERLKISASHKARTKSPEHLQKLHAFNASRRGKPLSPEHRKAVSSALKGRRPKNLEALWGQSRGKPWSEEQRASTMAAHAARKQRRLNGLES